jgi:hypothetical protein
MIPATKAPKRPRNRARCNYRFANDGRCRLLVPNSHARFCVHHTKSSSRRGTSDLATTLTANLREFKSAKPINDFLSRLLLALAHDRISPRRAAVLAYITNQLLRTVAAIERENDRQNDAETPERTIIWDMPCPAREEDAQEDAVSVEHEQPHKHAPIGRADQRRNQPSNLPAPLAKQSLLEESSAQESSAKESLAEESAACPGAGLISHSAHQTDAATVPAASLPPAHAPCPPGRVVYRNSAGLLGASDPGTNGILRYS